MGIKSISPIHPCTGNYANLKGVKRVEWVDVVQIKLDIVIIVIWLLYFYQMVKLQKESKKHFKITQVDVELAVQEQKRNQAESDLTQLRIKKAEFKADKKFGEDVKEIICPRIRQYEECRIPEIVKRIGALKAEKEKLIRCL